MRYINLLILIVCFSFTQSTVRVKLELPKLKDSNDYYIYHKGYTISYSEKHEQCNWSAYMICKKMREVSVPRKDAFRSDPSVKTGSAKSSDYSKTGYDRGHLTPAEDMSFSEESMSESFFMSNMSPQLPDFNRGIWKELEEKVRNLTNTYDTIYVVSGPILTDKLTKINGVSVPEYYFKAVLIYNKNYKVMCGFILKNEKGDMIENKVTSIDNIEKLAGLDLFYQLPDDVEEQMEKTSVYNF